jgi:hypothetical protein
MEKTTNYLEKGLLFGLILGLLYIVIEIIKLFAMNDILFSNLIFTIQGILSILVVSIFSYRQFKKLNFTFFQKIVFIFLFFQISDLSVQLFKIYEHEFYDPSYKVRIADLAVKRLKKSDQDFEITNKAVIENKEDAYVEVYHSTLSKYSNLQLRKNILNGLIINLFLVGLLTIILNSQVPITVYNNKGKL